MNGAENIEIQFLRYCRESYGNQSFKMILNLYLTSSFESVRDYAKDLLMEAFGDQISRMLLEGSVVAIEFLHHMPEISLELMHSIGRVVQRISPSQSCIKRRKRRGDTEAIVLRIVIHAFIFEISFSAADGDKLAWAQSCGRMTRTGRLQTEDFGPAKDRLLRRINKALESEGWEV